MKNLKKELKQRKKKKEEERLFFSFRTSFFLLSHPVFHSSLATWSRKDTEPRSEFGINPDSVSRVASARTDLLLCARPTLVGSRCCCCCVSTSPCLYAQLELLTLHQNSRKAKPTELQMISYGHRSCTKRGICASLAPARSEALL